MCTSNCSHLHEVERWNAKAQLGRRGDFKSNHGDIHNVMFKANRQPARQRSILTPQGSGGNVQNKKPIGEEGWLGFIDGKNLNYINIVSE